MKKFHVLVTVLLLGAVLTLLILIAVGQVEIGIVRAPQPTPPVPKSPTGPGIQRVPEAEKYFEVLGYEKACLFKYDGGWLDCWIEEDNMDGKTEVRGDYLGKDTKEWVARNPEKMRLIGQQPSGYVLWGRRAVKDIQCWDLVLYVAAAEGGPCASHRVEALSWTMDVVKGSTEGAGTEGPLTAGEEMTLYTVTSSAEKGKSPRKITLKCRLAK